jgi:cysteine sulfinate desulfinase/cysteine desulfurase-like protein
MTHSKLIYLDNNATTRVDPAVVEEILVRMEPRF